MVAKCEYRTSNGFTLIELSIVLVIIGLIVGGVLVGRDLIKAAAVRAQITQIEKFSTAANTFFGKYGYLPGDIPDPAASSFGFAPRGRYPGEGDGNGTIQGVFADGTPNNAGYFLATGEEAMFWVDLSTAHLIEGGFSTATSASVPALDSITPTSSPSIGAYAPEAKIGNGNYVYVWSVGGISTNGSGLNYFGIAGITDLSASSNNSGPLETPVMRVADAYAIDKKVDDGLPQSGRLLALYLAPGGLAWINGPASPWTTMPATYTSATAGSATSCYDNGNVAGQAQQYSIEISNGNNVNCAVSFRFQAGD